MSGIKRPRTPSYRRHKPSGQAVVTLDGRDYYLGRYRTKASRTEYERLVGECLANGRRMPRPSGGPTDLTVSELLAAYWRHAEAYYVKDGQPTSQLHCIRAAFRPLKRLYGHTQAADFGPIALKAVRQAFVEAGSARGVINGHIGRIRRAFKWGVSNELVPASVYHGLQAVEGLRRGRSEAREPEPVKPVPDEYVDAVRPHVSPQVWAMVQLQRLTGMRSGEVVLMRGCDLDTTGKLWLYRPASHKTQHHGHDRVIELGPRAQTVIRPFLKADTSAYLFCPAEAEAERNAERRRNGQTRITPSQAKRRRKRRARRAPTDRYTPGSYRRAIGRGCEQAFPPPPELAKQEGESAAEYKQRLTPSQETELRAWKRAHRWHPHQLRHNVATRVRKQFGLDAARALLGHRTLAVTDQYAELDRALATKVVSEVG